MSGIRFTIPGEPVAAPRMTRRDKWAKRDCVMRYRAWKDVARLVTRGSLPAPEQIASLSWTAYFVPPDSWSRKKRVAAIGQLHRSRPDRDNLDKAILDALFPEDSGIASGTIEKRWDWTPRVEICIEPLPPARSSE